MQLHFLSSLVLASLLFTGCGDDDGAPGDAGRADAGGSSDASATDAGPTDAGMPDGGMPDADMADAGPIDAGPVDGGAGTAMSFFVTSSALTGDGNLGGLAGADAHCQALATAVDSVRSTWVAYLSTEGMDGATGVSAIDRIGAGPWYNADEEVFAPDVTTLHVLIDPSADRDGYIAAKPADALFMDENGDSIPGRSHDILTGSNADGTVFAGRTCRDWTSNRSGDSAQVGHSDTPGNPMFSPSWNSAHNSAGCDADGVRSTGGAGLIYCFATP